MADQNIDKILAAFLCPFCNLHTEAVEFGDGDMGVVHTIPSCPMFDAMDPDVYLREVRKKFEKTKNLPN